MFIKFCALVTVVAIALVAFGIAGNIAAVGNAGTGSPHQPAAQHTAAYVAAESSKCNSYGMTASVDASGNVSCVSK